MIKDGKGGGNTRTGLIFEGKTDLGTFLASQDGYVVKNDIVYYQDEKVAEVFKKHGFYRFLEGIGVDWRSILSKQLLPDDSIYVMLQVRVGAGLVKEANKAAVLEHLNALNENYKVFKYYADEAGNIIIESCIPSTDDQFVPQMIHAVIDVIVDHLNTEYPKLMKAVWAE